MGTPPLSLPSKISASKACRVVSPDSSLVSGGADGSVCMWDLDGTDHQRGLEPTASVPRSRTRSHRFGVSSVSFYPSDAGLFVTGSYDKTVKVWDAAEMAPAFTFKLDTGVHSTGMAARALHSLVAVASEAATVRLLDLKTGTGTHSLVGHIGEVLAVGWSPRDEFLLASGGCDGTARLWDIRMAASCLASLDMDDTSRPGLDGRNCAHQGSFRLRHECAVAKSCAGRVCERACVVRGRPFVGHLRGGRETKGLGPRHWTQHTGEEVPDCVSHGSSWLIYSATPDKL